MVNDAFWINLIINLLFYCIFKLDIYISSRIYKNRTNWLLEATQLD